MAGFRIEPDRGAGYIRVATEGDLAPDHFARLIAETGAEAARSGVRRVFVDHSLASVAGLDREAILGVSQLAATINASMAGGRLAVLLAADLDYGLARIWLGYAEELLEYESQVFRDRDEALAWLLG